MITLRPYQAEDIATLLDSLRRGEHPVCVWPTGSGKSIAIASLCEALDGRILVVTHRKELIMQNESELLRLADADTGVYSAGVGRRELGARVIFAGVQSIYRRMEELQEAGPFRHVIIDEADLCPPPSQEGSMYHTVLTACTEAQRIGLTATPYRLGNGQIWGESDAWFDSCPVQRGISELTAKGFLSPLVGVQTATSVDTSRVRSRAGDYVLSDLSQVSSEESVVNAALDEVCYLARDRHSWLVFGVDISHCRLIMQGLIERGIDAACVFGETPDDERDFVIHAFKCRKLRALVNCEVLTTGSNIPAIDCVVLMRATQSKRLLVQQLGRGTRKYDDTKKNCVVLDLCDNLIRHMPIDGIPQVKRSPAKVEKENRERRAREERERKARHGIKAATGIDPLSTTAYESMSTLVVKDVRYYWKAARKYPSRTNIIATYKCLTEQGQSKSVQQFVLVEYPGRPGEEARAWFARRGLGMPERADWARRMLHTAPIPSEILVTKEGQWDRVIMERFDD